MELRLQGPSEMSWGNWELTGGLKGHSLPTVSSTVWSIRQVLDSWSCVLATGCRHLCAPEDTNPHKNVPMWQRGQRIAPEAHLACALHTCTPTEHPGATPGPIALRGGPALSKAQDPASPPRILRFPWQLVREQVRQTVAEALQVWSDVTPLTFTEVHEGHADIMIDFTR